MFIDFLCAWLLQQLQIDFQYTITRQSGLSVVFTLSSREHLLNPNIYLHISCMCRQTEYFCRLASTIVNDFIVLRNEFGLLATHTQCVWQWLIYNCQKVADLWYHGKTQASINLALIQRQTLCERDSREGALLLCCCDGVLEKTRALTMFACHLNLVCWHSGNNNRSASVGVKTTVRATQ